MQSKYRRFYPRKIGNIVIYPGVNFLYRHFFSVGNSTMEQSVLFQGLCGWETTGEGGGGGGGRKAILFDNY